MNSGGDAYCNNLTIESGAHLTIPVAHTMTVMGELVNDANADGLLLLADETGNASLIHNSTGAEATVGFLSE